MNRGAKQKQSNNPAEVWREFVQSELKSNSKLGKLLEHSGFGGYDKGILTLYFTEDQTRKAAQGQSKKIQDKLQSYRLQYNRIEFKTGVVPTNVQASSVKSSISKPRNRLNQAGNPLQALNFTEFGQDGKGGELSQPVLTAAVNAEKGCDSLYEKLNQRTKKLVGEEGVVIPASFSWRLRVGGTRGFRELLLPVFHPVFGIPYVPASGLKGAARAWAKRAGDDRIRQLLGMLEGKAALSAKVEFLDAFPVKPCLSVDIATPQWHWHTNQVVYKPEPHPLLSMEQPQLLIGLRPTARGSADDVQIVKEWLENALKGGIGSRVSSGYGRSLGQIASLPHYQSHNFELWTQGMYGSDPPTKENNYKGCPEFRPTAVRGVLRYWFRAVALSLYAPEVCQSLEDKVFGQLSNQGSLSINVIFNPATRSNPDLYTGTIILEATKPDILTLANYLLKLASSLGGVGRGSRRPLHLLNGRMRGCHWSVDSLEMPIPYELQSWQALFNHLRAAFAAIHSPLGSYVVNPGKPKQRQQDVLDKNAQIWLVQSPQQIHPEQVKNWQLNGDTPDVRGTALNLLYGDERFKGAVTRNGQTVGNPYVGGALETPSYVWIKSIFPRFDDPYQVVTIFGVNDENRTLFAETLQELKNERTAELVFGEMPTKEENLRSQRHRPERR